MPAPKIIADFDVQLATAISVGSTTFSLSSAIDDDGVALPAGVYYFTVDKGSTNKEYFKGTLSGTSITLVSSVSRQGVLTSGALRAHRVGASVELTDYATYKAYIDETSISGAPDASQSSKGVVEVATAAQIDANTGTGETGAPAVITADQLVLSKYGLALATVTPTGAISPYAGRSVPTGYLFCDGGEVSRATYPTLFSVLAPAAVVTMTIASPGVFTKTAHGLVEGDKIHFTTTGGLPSGLSLNTDYYVISAGLTADAFQLSAIPGGTAIVTSGSQSGVHTFYISNFGKGDGSSTFNVPDLRGRNAMGAGQGVALTTNFIDGNVDVANDTIAVGANDFLHTGQKVTLTTTGTLPAGLALLTTYYVIRVSSTSIKLATGMYEANVGSPVNITAAAGTGTHTINHTTPTNRQLARKGGTETQASVPYHYHKVNDSAGSGSSAFTTDNGSAQQNTNGVGIEDPNNVPPYMVFNYIIKT